MSVIKISELVEVVKLENDDTFPVVSDGATRKATIQQIIDIVSENMSMLSIVKVDSIDEVTQPNVLYLVPSSDTSSNIYNEYLLVDGEPELIGQQDVDLSDYSTTEEVETMINNAIGGALDGSY